MTTDDTRPVTADDAPVRRDRWSLEAGPLAEALLEIDRAVAGIETAKATLTARRHDFACVFREQVADRADDDSLAEDLREVIRALYWEYGTLRMTDLTAATGLDGERLRRIAGPQLVETGCAGCGAPTQVLQRSRGGRIHGRCPDCRRPEVDPFDESVPTAPPPPTLAPPVDVDWVDHLLDHLAARLPAEGCDNGLTLTRRWARREGVSEFIVANRLRTMGAYCDCEVLMNLRPPGPGSEGPYPPPH